MRKKGSMYALLATLVTILSSCSTSGSYNYPDANFRENVIVYINGKEYRYKDIYNLFDGKKESASAIFSRANSVLTQFVTPRTTAMKTLVENKMEDYRDQWTTNAKNNNTSYEEERAKTLQSENVLDELALENKLYVNEQVSENEKAYLRDVDGNNSYRYYISEDTTKQFVKDNAPYHVSHILLKLDASGDSEGIANGKISSDDSKQIGGLVKNLISKDSFGSIAQQFSDDTGSAAKYGELADTSNGVAMEKRTSYINEFKLGIYAYDAYINKNTSSSADMKKSVRLPGVALDDNSQDESVAGIIGNTKIGQKQVFGIPLSVALTMSVIADKDKSDSGSKPTNATKTQYPRNVYYKNYFNQHSISFIYDDSDTYDETFLAQIKETYKTDDVKKDIDHIAATADSDPTSVEKGLPARYEEYKEVKEILNTYTADKNSVDYKKKFTAFSSVANAESSLVTYTGNIQKDSNTSKYFAKNSVSQITDASNKNILTDERGNPILVVRGGSDSYQGIHFITVNQNPFVDPENNYKYWTITLPDSTKSEAAFSNDYATNPTFINFVKDSTSQQTVYKERATMIRNDIKASNSSLQQYAIWEYNLAKYNEKHNDDFLSLLGDRKNDVINYVEAIKKGTKKTANDSLDSSWESYINILNLYDKKQRRDLIPTVCVGYFNRGSYSIKDADKDVNIGEGCHVSI